MADEQGPLAAERRFFTALTEGNLEDLEQVLADDFLLIDVMSGSEIPRFALLEVLRSGQLRFEAIEPVEARVRLYGETAVVTGRTEMHGRYEDTSFTTKSRYTHVFVEQQGHWRLVAAQGTQISGE